VAASVLSEWQKGPSWFAAVSSSTPSPPATAPPVGGIFFPQRLVLKLDTHGYSTAILQKIVEAGGQLKSFALAAKMMNGLAEVAISPRHVANLTEEIGQELRQARDERAENWLHHRREQRTGPVPQAVAVAVDGGYIQTRAEGQGPGVHDQGWKEEKVACLHTLVGPTFKDDPHPDPPACFLDQDYVDKLVQDIKSHKRLSEDAEQPDEGTPDSTAAGPAVDAPENGQAAEIPPLVGPRDIQPTDETSANAGAAETFCKGGEPDVQPPTNEARTNAGAAETPAKVGEPEGKKVDWPPKRLVRTCVATQQSSEAFGPLVAQEAYARGFFEASRRAFLGDGLAYNWTIQRKWFKDFVAIADFIHPLSYLYVAATAVASSQAERWELYQSWMTACWQGRVGETLKELKDWQERLGPILAEEKPPGSDARVVVGKAVTYLENNQPRMDYPRYRRLGLPVTSCAVESLIKEFNYRVKGTEKFWNRPEGTEKILQVRAAVLSEDDRLAKHLKKRPGSPYRRYGAQA
jgi:hypothetical protein